MAAKQAERSSKLESRGGGLLLGLAWAAGFVDAASYLGLGGVFTANMTGNTVFLSLALARLDLAGALRSAVALAGFCIGVLGGALPRVSTDQPAVSRAAVTKALGLECAVLMALMIGWSSAGITPDPKAVVALLLLSGCAMGLQSAALQRIGVAPVGSTAITGIVTGVMAGAVGWLHASEGRAKPPSAASKSRSAFSLPATVWLVYALGALAGGMAEAFWHGAAIAWPAAAVGLVTLIALLRVH